MKEANGETVRYKSYLLRVRYYEQDGEVAQQAMLQAVPSGQQHYFSDMQALVQFLQCGFPQSWGEISTGFPQKLGQAE